MDVSNMAASHYTDSLFAISIRDPAFRFFVWLSGATDATVRGGKRRKTGPTSPLKVYCSSYSGGVAVVFA